MRNSPIHRLAVVILFCCSSSLYADFAEDEALLRQSKIGLTNEDLLHFLELRSSSESELAEIQRKIRQLGADEFEQRESASQWLILRGRKVTPFLKQALDDPDAEVAKRAQACLTEILDGPDLSRVSAVLRLLGKRRPKGTARVVLRFLPFEDDESVTEEAWETLKSVCVRDGVHNPDLLEALQSPHAVCREASAYVLGRSRDEKVQQRVERLLQDKSARVRLRACEGLLAGDNPKAVSALIALLEEAPLELAWRAESLLHRVAQESSPQVSSGGGTPKERTAWKNVWLNWWTENRTKIDLAKVNQLPVVLGLTLVSEMHGNRIWEVDRQGKVRWEMKNLTQPREAVWLPSGRVLVAEASAGRVTERDRSGKIYWEHTFPDPAYIKRLPNGHTVLGNHNKAIEVTRDGKLIFSYQPTPQFLIHSMFRKDNGNLVCLSMGGLLLEVDRTGKELFRVQLNANNRNWCGVEGLAGNRYLVVDLLQGDVLEVDRLGKTRWQCKIPGASYALRLPNGNTMVCSFNQKRVVYVNSKGKILREHAVKTSPWRAHWR